MSEAITVNSQPAEAGCYSDNMGQDDAQVLADVAEGFGWKPTSEQDDPRWWRKIADNLVDQIVPGGPSPGDMAWSNHLQAAMLVEVWLNRHTDGGHWTHHEDKIFLVAGDWPD